ncbi:MAG: HAD family hydrolase [Planctomycetota bacterium]|nr:HAD family hydrolase [Planctomycetota bacterium]
MRRGSKPRPAIFFDRDGTLLKERLFLTDPRRVRLYRSAGKAIALLSRAGFVTVLASNQSGIARGLLNEAVLHRIHSTLQRKLERTGARLDAIYYCPHLPPKELTSAPMGDAAPQECGRSKRNRYLVRCSCRKPQPGLLVRAARELGIDLSRSLMIGDSLRDLDAARAAGCRGVLVLTGNGRKTASWLRSAGRVRSMAVHVARDVLAAARWIVDSKPPETPQVPKVSQTQA